MQLDKEFKELSKYINNHDDLPFYNDFKLKAMNFKFMLATLYRYATIIKVLKQYINESKQCIDFGSYPGQLQECILQMYKVKFTLSGLHFSDDFKSYFKEWELIDADFEEKQDNTSKKEFYDVSTSFNIIEHMEYPNKLLDTINYYTKKDGILVLTTDNISTFSNLRNIYHGKSPNEHLIKSKIFYNGEWRPHIRIFSKDELKFLLNYSGFKIIDHNYFDHRAREYFFKNGKLNRVNFGIKEKILELIKKRKNHFRDHHIIVAKKVIPYDELDLCRPHSTNSTDEWVSYRNKLKEYDIFKKTI